MYTLIITNTMLFLSTLSLRRATRTATDRRIIFFISIHALLAESDLSMAALRQAISPISIHALLAESDKFALWLLTYHRISIHALLAESDMSVYGILPVSVAMISIHALLAESDPRGQLPATQPPYFYPRSPCGERPVAKRTTDIRPPFLSTLSLRRATARIFLGLTFHEHFYPRSPCGERLTSEVSERVPLAISIHALLAESDVMYSLILANTMLFLSTLSLRRATCACCS